MGLAARIEKNWYGHALGNLWLLPLWCLFVLISALRRVKYQIFPASPADTPVLVVGNIAIGGRDLALRFNLEHQQSASPS